MLILQIAIGIVLGGVLLAYLGDILLLGFGAIIILVLIAIVGIIGIVIYESVSYFTLVQSIFYVGLAYIFLKWYTNDAKLKLKKSLIEQIKKKESLGYDASELKLRLTKLEEEEALLAIQAKEKLAIDMANKAKNKKVSKLSNNALAKERERRKSLGYDE
jgi:hypothetical protein